MPIFLDRYPAIDTDDREVARQGLISVFGADGFDTDAQNFSFLCNFARLPNSGLAYGAFRGAASISVPATGLVRQCFSIQGRGRLRSGGLDISIDSWTPVITGSSRFEMQLDDSFQQIVFRADQSALERTIKALVGDSSDRPLQFDEGADPDPMTMAVLRRHVFQLAIELDRLEAARSPLAVAEFERNALVTFLLAHKHNFRHFFDLEPAQADLGVVQRVEAFLEQNWDRSIDFSELAAVANVSVRTIFRDFKRAGKGSPTQFLKRIRLERAARLLAEPESDTTVTGVALRCGFQNLGHFSADYSRLLGELPSETLRRGRKK